MHISSFLKCFLPLLPLALAQDRDFDKVQRAFAAANIQATISLPFDPIFFLDVSFPQTTGPNITLHAGIQLPRNATARTPTFRVVGSASSSYVVAAIDPDAPTPQTPTNAQIRHFLGGNFTPTFPDTTNVHPLRNDTPAITVFRQPTPPAGSDPHRYIFLLFEQPPGFNEQKFVNSTTPTLLFNISQFSAETGLGAPIAGTFMLVGPDPATA